MARLSLNPKKAKIHRSYSVAEVALLYGVSRGAVRAWCKAGLHAAKIGGEFLIYGDDLRAFLEQRRASQRATCPPGTLFCVGCRAARRPHPEAARLTPFNEKSGNVQASCPQCGAAMNRRVSLPRLAESGFEGLGVRPAALHLDHSPNPSVKPHSERNP